jgi:hypothetical protein
MKSQSLRILMVFFPLTLAAQSLQQRTVPLNNWTAPRQVHRSQLQTQQRVATPKIQLPGGVTSDVLVFVPIAPCRLADTRPGSGYPALGSTPLAALTPLTLQIAGACGVESTGFLFPGPEAFSLNVTVVPPGGTVGGYLLVYPNPITPIPLVASMTWNPGASYQANAVVSAASPGGSVNVVANATTDVVIDINGYYAAPGDSKGDTALGTGALNGDTTGGGNTALGFFALFSNTMGSQNTAIGDVAVASNTTASDNTGVGYEALNAVTVGPWNTAVGAFALSTNQGSGANTAVGYNALLKNNPSGAVFEDGAGGNTAVGYQALYANTSGSDNIAIGIDAGAFITTGSDNIMIGHDGTSTDNGTIRIGDFQTATFIAGISGTTVAGTAVVVNADGQLGVAGPSSRRYKDDIQDMGDASQGLLGLRPVTFHYKKPDADGSTPLEYGLIAEEVADVYPELVVRGKDGEVESVQYQKLPAMLLNEFQKQNRQIQEQSLQIQTLQKLEQSNQIQREQIQKLEARLAALEAQLASVTPPVAFGKAIPAGGR